MLSSRKIRTLYLYLSFTWKLEKHKKQNIKSINGKSIYVYTIWYNQEIERVVNDLVYCSRRTSAQLQKVNDVKP